MKALVYYGPGKMSWEEKERPVIEAGTDAIVKILKTSICGTDLHIFKGDLPTIVAGRTVGHEGVGVIEEIGGAVANFEVGQHVVISCISACGNCASCRAAMYSQCENGGWILGHLIDGTQAEYVRIPFADHSLYAIPPGADEEAMVMLSDILPTGYECGVMNGEVKPGDSVAIVGGGPVGLAVLLTAQFLAPAMTIVVDQDSHRLKMASSLGTTHVIDSRFKNAADAILRLTDGKGVDVAIEAVGVPETFAICESVLAAGGHLANVGVHATSVTLHIESLWSKNITLTTRLVDTSSTPILLKLMQAGRLAPTALITHRFPLSEIITAYEVFGNAADEKALKVILTS
jgi:alcohol dehydrogenase